MNEEFRIIITTKNSAAWLSDVLSWYLHHDLRPLFIVDSRSNDMTRDLILNYGFTYKEFTPRGDYPEAGMLEFGAWQSDKEWILRLDDDELPSTSLLEWIANVGVKSKNQCWFISRRELFSYKKDIIYSRSLGKYPLAQHPHWLHPMARLYHRNRVTFLEEIHTTGLNDLLLYDFVPAQFFIIHFNCLLHSIEDRLSKLEAYEKLAPCLAMSLSDEYLPEIFSVDFHNAANDGFEEFQEFLGKIKKPQNRLNISKKQQERLVSMAKTRAHELLRKRYQVKLYCPEKLNHISADDISWIELIPLLKKGVMLEFMSLILPKSNKTFADALWNYYKIHVLR